MKNKYLIKNCDSSYYNIDDKLVCAAFKKPEPYFCQDCTDCLLKKIAELCNESIRPNESNLYRAGRMSLAVNIIGMLEIEEIKDEKTKNEK